jgi:hypothetical protein
MQNRARRYSDTIEQEMAGQVGAIEARRGGDSFRTRAFASAEGTEEWHEAVRGANRTWSVVQYRRAPGMYPGKNNEFSEEKAVTRSVLFRNACFFDALYACAEFEVGSAAQGDLLKPVEENIEKTHYEAYAKAEGIVFDLRNQMPVPVANGEVLADNCTLADDALETVKLSQGNAPAQAAPKDIDASEIVGGGDLLPLKTSGSLPAIVTRKDGLLATEKRARARLDKINMLSRKFQIAAQKEFKSLGVYAGGPDEFGIAPGVSVIARTGLGAAAGAFLLGALVPPLAVPCAVVVVLGGGAGGIATLLTGMGCFIEGKTPIQLLTEYGWTRPGKALDRQLTKFHRALDSELAGPAEKEELGDMVKKLRIGCHTLSARYAFKRAAEAGFIKAPFANMVLNRRILRLQSVARDSGLMSDAEIGRLVEGLQQEAGSARFEEGLAFAIGEQIHVLAGFVKKINTREAEQATELRSRARIPHLR